MSEDETTLQRVRKALRNIGLPEWARWIDRALEHEDERIRRLEFDMRLALEPTEDPSPKEYEP